MKIPKGALTQALDYAIVCKQSEIETGIAPGEQPPPEQMKLLSTWKRLRKESLDAVGFIFPPSIPSIQTKKGSRARSASHNT
jgi:hypothetical protein